MLEAAPPVPRLWLAQHLLERAALAEKARRAPAPGSQPLPILTPVKSETAPNVKPRTRSNPSPRGVAAAAAEATRRPQAHEAGVSGRTGAAGSGKAKPLLQPEWNNKVAKLQDGWEPADESYSGPLTDRSYDADASRVHLGAVRSELSLPSSKPQWNSSFKEQKPPEKPSLPPMAQAGEAPPTKERSSGSLGKPKWDHRFTKATAWEPPKSIS